MDHQIGLNFEVDYNSHLYTNFTYLNILGTTLEQLG